MQAENFSPKDSLMLIDSMINQAKNRFSENGFLYLMWGWLILICSLGHFVLIQMNWFKHPEMIWASCWLAVIFQIFYLIKQQKKESVKTYSEHIIGYIWMSFGITMGIISVILAKTQSWEILNSLVLMLYGTPTFLSGVVMRFRPLKAGGIVCWILAALSVFVMPVYVLLILATAVVAAWIIPGYMLRARYNLINKK